MEKTLAVEEARRKLGALVREVAFAQTPIVLSRRNRERAVLLGYGEYERLKSQEARNAERRFHDALARIHAGVVKARVKPSIVRDAVRRARNA